MTKTYLGIEIGNMTIKFVVSTQNTIKQCVVEQLPDNIVRDGGIVSWEAMAQFMKQKLKEHKIGEKKVALVLPERLTYVRRFTMPYMTIAQLKFNLPFEFHDFITEEKEQYLYDYAIMGIMEEELEEENQHKEHISKNMDVLGVAISKQLIEKYRMMLKRCGLKLQVAAPQSCAYQNMIRKYEQLYAKEKGLDYAILDIGHSVVELRIYTEGKYETGREIEPGLQAITQLISDTLGVDEHIAEIYKRNNQDNILYSEQCMSAYSDIALDIMRVINFFTYNHPNNTLEVLYCCGGGTKIAPLMQTLSDIIGLKVIPLNEVFASMTKEEDTMLLAASAVGITWN